MMGGPIIRVGPIQYYWYPYKKEMWTQTPKEAI